MHGAFMRIRFDHPAAARLTFQPGDELVVRKLTPELEAILANANVAGQFVARIVRGKDDKDEDSDTATVDAAGETATTNGRGTRGSQRTAPVS
jgi:hypothetical protein